MPSNVRGTPTRVGERLKVSDQQGLYAATLKVEARTQ